MNLDWQQIGAALTALGTLYGGIRHTVVRANLALQKKIKEETKSLSEKLDSLEESQKTLDHRLDHLWKAVKEYKSYSANGRERMDAMQEELRRTVQANTDAVKEFSKTQIEMLSKELMLIKGNKNH